MKKLPRYFFLLAMLLLLGSGIKSHASESDIAFDDYKIEDTPRTEETGRKVVITTTWKGYLPVRNGYRTHKITIPTIKIKQGEILSLELVCDQEKQGSSYATVGKVLPTWKINTELNHDFTSYLCDLLIKGPDVQRYLPWGMSPMDINRIVYGETFYFRSIGKTGHFELEYTVPNLYCNYWKTSSGKLVIRVSVDIVSASPETSAELLSQ